MINLDSDLESALEYNPQENFTAENILNVMAVFEGEREDANWAWVLKLTGGRFAYLQAWCDYTGWDCQSGAHSYVELKPLKAVQHAIKDYNAKVYNSLSKQMREGKNRTWRENKDAELKVNSMDTISP